MSEPHARFMEVVSIGPICFRHRFFEECVLMLFTITPADALTYVEPDATLSGRWLDASVFVADLGGGAVGRSGRELWRAHRGAKAHPRQRPPPSRGS